MKSDSLIAEAISQESCIFYIKPIEYAFLPLMNVSYIETNSFFNPNHPKSCKILLETGTFTSSNGAKLLPGKKYRP